MTPNDRLDLVKLLDLPPRPGVNPRVAEWLLTCSTDDLNTPMDHVDPGESPSWVRAPLWLLMYREQCRGLNTFARYGNLSPAETRKAQCQAALTALEQRGANLLLLAKNEDALFIERLKGSITSTAIVAPHAEMIRDLLNERRHALEKVALTTAATNGSAESTKPRPRL